MENSLLMPEINSALFEGHEEPKVLVFNCHMALSQLYQFNIEVACKRVVHPSQALNQRVSLLFAKKGKGRTPLSGQINHFAQLENVDDYYIYRFQLVPQVTRLLNSSHTEVFLDKTVPDVIKEVFHKNGINSVEFQLTGDYKKKDFIFQYNENDWDFISRWMESEGLFYYFEHQIGQEVLIITDSNSTVKINKDIHSLYYQAYTVESEDDPHSNLVYDFQYTAKAQPQRVVVKAYNNEQASKLYTSTATVDGAGSGEIMIWAENVRNNKENQKIANIHAESYRCQKELFSGTSSGSLIIPGTIIQHKKFTIPSLNKPLLITQSTYQGSQKKSFYSLHSSIAYEKEDYFTCSYQAIDKSISFRAPILTPIPRVSGILPGFVDHEGKEDSVQINDKGLYKFRLAINNETHGKGSNWVRKMESYIGDKYALSLPLRKDMEVVIAFQFGNPDLPILLGTVDNSTHRNMITSKNQSYFGLQTKEKNTIYMNEQLGKTQGIKISTPNNKTSIILGTDNIFESKFDAGYYLSTESNNLQYVALDKNTTVQRDVNLTVHRDLKHFIYGNSSFVCKQNAVYQIDQDMTFAVKGSNYNYVDKDVYNKIGENYVTAVGGNYETSVQGSKSLSVVGDTQDHHHGFTMQSYYGERIYDVMGLSFNSEYGGSINFKGPFSMNITEGWKYEKNTAISLASSPIIHNEAEEAIILKVGSSAISITDQFISISSPSIFIESLDIVRIQSESCYIQAPDYCNLNGYHATVGNFVSLGPVVDLGSSWGLDPGYHEAQAYLAQRYDARGYAQGTQQFVRLHDSAKKDFLTDIEQSKDFLTDIEQSKDFLTDIEQSKDFLTDIEQSIEKYGEKLKMATSLAGTGYGLGPEEIEPPPEVPPASEGSSELPS
ncbi:TPA: type VI secretion system tip protein VgrG [Legionella pneumophila]|nr:type VI secretion system tip protein VgrG [Legionella pneumophila]HAT2143630.1 type VI secretion system tip protein VgrG [Legionella pneumophila]HAT2146781.1 type VI secretion system tip protein VgrG [Legionella pneumophila]HAT2161898.1 type VI secretion system tip protein VgrG [Legionella pneumophila]HAT3987297.1 type VI secretion system tip protein VgrG [Legionella pneumophila]